MRMFVTGLATLLLVGGAAAAEPPKAAPAKRPASTQPATPRAEIVLASAESAHVPPTDGAQPAEATPKRHVAPRVTTCRCGDPQVAPETQDQ